MAEHFFEVPFYIMFFFSSSISHLKKLTRTYSASTSYCVYAVNRHWGGLVAIVHKSGSLK